MKHLRIKNMKWKYISKHLILFSWDYFNKDNTLYFRHIMILSPCNSDVRHIGLISPCKSDNCRCAKSVVILTRSIWGKYRNIVPHNWEWVPPYSPNNSWLGSVTTNLLNLRTCTVFRSSSPIYATSSYQ